MMENPIEFFDAWLKSQKDFMDNWLGSQKGMMENWLDATKKIQYSFGAIAGSRGGSHQLFEIFNSWFSTMLNSSKVFTESIANLQNAWKEMTQKQMDMNKEIAGHFMDLFSKMGEAKKEA
jgi:hypothetical protein